MLLAFVLNWTRVQDVRKFFFGWTNDMHGFITAQASRSGLVLQQVTYARHRKSSVSYHMLVVYQPHFLR